MQNGLSTPDGHILFVDDDADILKAAGLLLGRRGLRMSAARNPAEAWSVMAAEPVDAVLLDLNFERGQTSGEAGFRCLGELLAQDPDAVVVVVTGHSGVNIAVAAMRAGASDFIMKPWNNDRLMTTLENALDLRRQKRERAALKDRPDPGPASAASTPLLGDSPAIARIRDLIRRVAPTDASVLVHGEPGVGKGLIARTIHQQSLRAAGPFLAVDLAGLSPEETETTLFGGGRATDGVFAQARGGTLFLDEIAALPAALQGRLLDAIEARRTVRDAEGRQMLDVRIVAATRRRPAELQGRGGLRDDLLFRLNTVEIIAPPLRERGQDALLLARHFLRLFAQRHGRPVKQLAPEAADAIAAHGWPGDVRALSQAMERCVIFAEGERYELADIPFAGEEIAQPAPARTDLNLALSERAMIAAALKRSSFNVSQAAKQLGLTRAALYRRMAKHGL